MSEEAPSRHARPGASRQAVMYCPYCSEENLFPLEGGGWECRSCRRAFSVTFLGLIGAGAHTGQEFV